MRYLVPFCFLLLLLAACGKSKDEKKPTRTELLSASAWKYESAGIDQDRNGTIDISLESTGVVQPCMLDNTGTFHADGTGVADEGANKCAANPQSSPFTWHFADNEQSLSITGTLFGLGGQFKIVTLTDAHLTLSKDSSINFGGVPLTVSLIANLKH